uniref:Uncharacterized protein n=1 Tax=Knufia peltigerae TaxID=1002370 RepID=A0AA39CWD9_9EURO|nr:hypothetical protein H2204_008155 [Knufia peltigerae]
MQPPLLRLGAGPAAVAHEWGAGPGAALVAQSMCYLSGGPRPLSTAGPVQPGGAPTLGEALTLEDAGEWRVLGLPHFQGVQMEKVATLAGRGDTGHLAPVTPQCPAPAHLHPPGWDGRGAEALVANRRKHAYQLMSGASHLHAHEDGRLRLGLSKSIPYCQSWLLE